MTALSGSWRVVTRRVPIAIVAGAVTLAVAAGPAAAPAGALNIAKPICSLAGIVSTLAGRVCSVASHPGRVLQAGQKLLGGHLGGAVESLAGGGVAKAVTAATVIGAIVAWVGGGAHAILHETARVIGSSTRPALASTWFSASYWRLTGIAALLTIPFLCAAAIQAVLRADLTLLARSALGYLPLGVLAVSVATPITMLLLAASDQLSALIAGAAGGAPATALNRLAAGTAVFSVGSRSSFLAFFVGLFMVVAAGLLWIELLIRAAAIYVVVLMLPLFFAAVVWPARRVWATRVVELLIALIVSKFAIVAVLSLGGSALGSGPPGSIATGLAGTTLVLLAALAPWGLLRLLPLHELAAGLDGLRGRGGALPASLKELAPGSPDPAEAARALAADFSAGTDAPGASMAGPAAAEATGPRAGTASRGGEVAGSDGSPVPLVAAYGAAEEQRPPADETSLAPAATAVAARAESPGHPSGPGPRPGSPADTAGSPMSAEPSVQAPPGASDGSPPASGPPERSPGMAPIFQAPDFAHPTIVFGPDSLPGEEPPPGSEPATEEPPQP